MKKTEVLAAITSEMINHTDLTGHDRAVLRNRIYTYILNQFSYRKANRYTPTLSIDPDEVRTATALYFRIK